MDPDRDNWASRSGYLANRAMMMIGLPRPIRHLLKWPILLLLLLGYVLTFPIRFLWYLLKPV